MAGAMIGEGTDYAGLTYTVGANSEEYGVGFRKATTLLTKSTNSSKQLMMTTC